MSRVSLDEYDDHNKTFAYNKIIPYGGATSSKGNQEKWLTEDGTLFLKGQFFYQGKLWRDYRVEVIASQIGSSLNLKYTNVMQQEVCLIEHKRGKHIFGTVSEKFDGKFVSFNKLHKLSTEEDYDCLGKSCAEIYSDVIELMSKFVEREQVVEYIDAMILIDYIIANEDRHFNNFGLLGLNGTYQLAPLFDFGLGLFEHDRRYDGVRLSEARSMIQGKPFSTDLREPLDMRFKTISKMLPECFDTRELTMPNKLAALYFEMACSSLGVKLLK